MSVGRIQHAVGIFSNRQQAEYALTELRDAGFNMDKISVIVQNANPNEQVGGVDVSDTKEQQIEQGAKSGATTGAAAGSIIGLVVSLSVLAIPGVGLAAEVGVLLGNALIGGVIGAAGGAVAGALTGWGIPEDRAKHYDERLAQGNYLVVVEGTAEEILRAEAILEQQGVLDWGIYDAPSATGGGDAPITTPAGRGGVL